MAARHWTKEQRMQQSAKIRQWQPWDKSTGPNTPEGKATASRNADKGGVRSMMRKIAKLLRKHREVLNQISR
jgi:hypothetical protein